ncbi:hypothetical protein ACFV2H_06545 [Streptomyces sp. NPDC059629]|uniref:hypothetical protein n=1 Tax=Streptomyces sp. NPDC059629 TaxID=3346889 RepID=UPI0036AD99F1
MDFDARVDFRLPGAVWAFTLLRGITAHTEFDVRCAVSAAAGAETAAQAIQRTTE